MQSSKRIARRDKKAFLSDQCKEIEENNRKGKTRDLFKKIGAIKEAFHARMDTINDRNGKDLREAEQIKKRWQEYTEELWTEVHDIVQKAVIKTIPRRKKCKKAKWLSDEVLQIAEERREVKSKGERERYIQLDAEFQRIAE